MHLDTAIPFFHPGLWPLAANSANSRSTSCLTAPAMDADSNPLLGNVVHPAISSANLSAASRLKPREVGGRHGDVFAHPAVVTPGAVGALEREEMGRIGFGAISHDKDSLKVDGVWSKRSKSVKHVRKKTRPTLERYAVCCLSFSQYNSYNIMSHFKI